MTESSETNLQSDPLLRDAPTIRGFKVLDPAVLYAKVGQGGMGAVYRGRHFKLDIDVAVKCLRPSLADESPDFAERFEREARLAAQLTHQNVVRVMDVHKKHGIHYLVMEFVTGENARERVLRKGKLAEQEALAVVLGAVSGLAEAHTRGIVHRDIKPDNVLVSLEGRVKLADLGLAKASQSSGQTISLASGVMGTPQYMAPEQWDSANVGPTADVWAIGASMYYLLVAEHAIDAPNLAATARKVQDQPFPSLRDARPGLRDEVYAFFERCVAKDPADRFADAGAMLKVLRPLVSIDEGALVDPESSAKPDAEGMVSPPPRETLMTIRAKVESGILPTEADGIDFEAETIPSRRRGAKGEVPQTVVDEKVDTPRGKAGKVLLALVALVAVVGGGGWMAGWFDDPINWEQVEREARAKSLYWDAKKLLPKPDGLDQAIAKLEECLQLMQTHELAREPLAMALDKRAEKLTKTDLDGAYLASKRALEIGAKQKEIKDRYEVLEQALRDRLFAGLEITSPPGFEVRRSSYFVVPGKSFELKGRVTSKGFKELHLYWPDKVLDKDGVRGLQVVPVVAGEFSVQVNLAAAGDSELKIYMADELGVGGNLTPVMRACGAVGIRIMVGTTPLSRTYNAAGLHMRGIRSGTFTMGSPLIEPGHKLREKQAKVTLTKHYWMAETEVTRAQWFRIMKTEPWTRSNIVGLLDLPASDMSQADAVEFCRRLTKTEGDAGRLPKDYVYMLPTEAQWEFACRAGSTTPYSGEATLKNLSEYAVFGQERPQVVGQRKPNPWNLYDMHGNVGEYCADKVIMILNGDMTSVKDGAVDPLLEGGAFFVHRGGRYGGPAEDCRSAARMPKASLLNVPSPGIGFRPVLARRR